MRNTTQSIPLLVLYTLLWIHQSKSQETAPSSGVPQNSLRYHQVGHPFNSQGIQTRHGKKANKKSPITNSGESLNLQKNKNKNKDNTHVKP